MKYFSYLLLSVISLLYFVASAKLEGSALKFFQDLSEMFYGKPVSLISDNFELIGLISFIDEVETNLQSCQDKTIQEYSIVVMDLLSENLNKSGLKEIRCAKKFFKCFVDYFESQNITIVPEKSAKPISEVQLIEGFNQKHADIFKQFEENQKIFEELMISSSSLLKRSELDVNIDPIWSIVLEKLKEIPNKVSELYSDSEGTFDVLECAFNICNGLRTRIDILIEKRINFCSSTLMLDIEEEVYLITVNCNDCIKEILSYVFIEAGHEICAHITSLNGITKKIKTEPSENTSILPKYFGIKFREPDSLNSKVAQKLLENSLNPSKLFEPTCDPCDFLEIIKQFEANSKNSANVAGAEELLEPQNISILNNPFPEIHSIYQSKSSESEKKILRLYKGLITNEFPGMPESIRDKIKANLEVNFDNIMN